MANSLVRVWVFDELDVHITLVTRTALNFNTPDDTRLRVPAGRITSTVRVQWPNLMSVVRNSLTYFATNTFHFHRFAYRLMQTNHSSRSWCTTNRLCGIGGGQAHRVMWIRVHVLLPECALILRIDACNLVIMSRRTPTRTPPAPKRLLTCLRCICYRRSLQYGS